MNELEERKWSIYNQPVRFVHVCKCTCFTTNVTLIPIYWPKDGRNLCSTCTKNFCVEQVEGCRGAQIVEANSDTATGFEGQVWAKCFVRDPTRDQSIVFLYLVCVLGLLAWALVRSRLGQNWLQGLRNMVRRHRGI